MHWNNTRHRPRIAHGRVAVGRQCGPRQIEDRHPEQHGDPHLSGMEGEAVGTSRGRSRPPAPLSRDRGECESVRGQITST
jgi:hypothetical protein